MNKSKSLLTSNSKKKTKGQDNKATNKMVVDTEPALFNNPQLSELLDNLEVYCYSQGFNDGLDTADSLFTKRNNEEIKKICQQIQDLFNKEQEPKVITHHVKLCTDAIFHEIECLEMEDKYGFEGYYDGDINHPDYKPSARIWIKKKDAEKLFRLFNKQQNWQEVFEDRVIHCGLMTYTPKLCSFFKINDKVKISAKDGKVVVERIPQTLDKSKVLIEIKEE